MKPKYDISFFPPAVAHMLSEVYLCDKLLRYTQILKNPNKILGGK